MSKFINRILRNIDNMPSLPITVAKVLEVTKDPNFSPNSLNKVISLDPVLTGRVLQICNSAYYSLPNRVTSIVKAIIYLGVNTIRNLAITSAVIPIVGLKKRGYWKTLKVAKFWQHSLGTGATAKLIAKSLGVDSKIIEEYFICGFLHDIGKIVLERNLSDEYTAVIKKVENDSGNLIDIETKLLGINHCDVGKMLVDKWKLSESISQVIEYHHNTEDCDKEYSNLVYSVAVANNFCNRNEIGYSGNSSNILQNAKLLSSLSLTEKILDSWKPAIFEEIERASIFLNIK